MKERFCCCLSVFLVFFLRTGLFLCVYPDPSPGSSRIFDLSKLEYFPFESVEFEFEYLRYVAYLSMCSPVGDALAGYLPAKNEWAVLLVANSSTYVTFSRPTARYSEKEKLLRMTFESRTPCRIPGSESSTSRHLLTVNLRFFDEHMSPRFATLRKENCELVVDWRTYLSLPVHTAEMCSYELRKETLNLNWLKHPKGHVTAAGKTGPRVVLTFCPSVDPQEKVRNFLTVIVEPEEGNLQVIKVEMSRDSCAYDYSRRTLKCHSNYAPKSAMNRTVWVNVACDPNEFNVRPVAFDRRKKKSLVVDVKTFAVCALDASSCSVMENSNLYEVPKYGKRKFQWQDRLFILNDCEALLEPSSGPGKSSGVMIRSAVGSQTKEVVDLGLIRALEKMEGDSIRLTMTGGSSCRNDSQRIRTEIEFVCSQNEMLSHVESGDPCRHMFLWNHPVVCPYQVIRERSCFMRDERTKFSCNLTSEVDEKNLFSIYNGELVLEMDFCGPTGIPCNLNPNASVCLKRRNGETVLGLRSTQVLVYDKNFLSFEMTGEPCLPGIKSRVRVDVKCDFSAPEDSSPTLISWKHCSLELEWRTRRACVLPEKEHCLVKGSSGDAYDLLSLRKEYSNYRVETNGTDGVILNACSRLWYGKDEMCPTNVAVCRLRGRKYESLGNLPGTLSANEGGEVVATYTTTLLCPSSRDSPVGSKVIFRCGSEEGFPQYLGYRDCYHTFVWLTRHVCSPAVVGTKLEHDTVNKISQKSLTTAEIDRRVDIGITGTTLASSTVGIEGAKSKFKEKTAEPSSPKFQDYWSNSGPWMAAINKTTVLYSGMFNPVEDSGHLCPGSLSCLLISSSIAISLGSRHGFPYRRGDSVRLDYFEGSVCDKDRQIRYSSSSTFTCRGSRKQREEYPRLSNYSTSGPCHFDFEWETSCVGEPVTFHRSDCTLVDDKGGKSMDLKRILAGVKVEVEVGERKIVVDLCGVDYDGGTVGCRRTWTWSGSGQVGFYDALENTTWLSLYGNNSCRNGENGDDIVLEMSLKCTEGVHGEEQKNLTARGTERHVILHWESPLLCFKSMPSSRSSGQLPWILLAVLVVVCGVIAAGIYYWKKSRVSSGRDSYTMASLLETEHCKRS